MQISRSALVLHSALDMYRLVYDVPSYPQFLSWCTGASVLEEDDQLQLASLTVAISGMSQSFTTRNRLERGSRLIMNLVEGPFQSLEGEWRFTQLGEQGSKVTLDLGFETSSSLVSAAFGKGFAHVADRLVRDFVVRADSVLTGSGQ